MHYAIIAKINQILNGIKMNKVLNYKSIFYLFSFKNLGFLNGSEIAIISLPFFVPKFLLKFH